MLTATRAGQRQSLVVSAMTAHEFKSDAEQQVNEIGFVSALFRGRKGGCRWVERDDTKKAESSTIA